MAITQYNHSQPLNDITNKNTFISKHGNSKMPSGKTITMKKQVFSKI